MTEDSGWIKAERDHEREMAKVKNFADQDRRQQRNVMVGYIATAFAVVLVVASIALALYGWNTDNAKRQQQVELACIDAGGTWTGIGGGRAVCVRIQEMPK